MGRYMTNAGVPAKRAARPHDRGSGDASDGDADFSQRIADQARKLLDDELGARLGRGASDLNRLSDALRGAGSRLEGSAVGPYFERAAGQLEHVAELLQHMSSRDMIEGVQRFARERPLLYLGSAVALGIGAGRFLRSSSMPLLESGASAVSEPETSSSTEAAARTTRRSARNRNREASQTRGTSHE